MYIFSEIRSPIIVGNEETDAISIVLSTLKHNLPSCGISQTDGSKFEKLFNFSYFIVYKNNISDKTKYNNGKWSVHVKAIDDKKNTSEIVARNVIIDPKSDIPTLNIINPNQRARIPGNLKLEKPLLKTTLKHL